MSKVGQKNIEIPTGIQVEVNNKNVVVRGTKGQLEYELPRGIQAEVQDNQVSVTRKNDSKTLKSFHGLYRSLIANAIEGLANGWTKRLEIVGTGYNVKMQGQDLVLKVGYSNPVIFQHVEGVQFATEGNNIVVISGADKQLVGEVAQQIKIIKKPDPYKGKGIRYQGEHIRLKPGKKAKVA